MNIGWFGLVVHVVEIVHAFYPGSNLYVDKGLNNGWRRYPEQ